MMTNEGIVEFICEGGFGGEARIKVELRTKFPGIGGTIITREGVASALREEYNTTPKTGHRLFLRHVIIKKIEDYFYRTGVYVFSHIPRPLGSISRTGKHPYEAYLYEWAFGSDGFPWEYSDSEGNRHPIELHDWNNFAGNFSQTGIDLKMDVTDSEDGRTSQNIVHQYLNPIAGGLEMCSLWKRIDFGYRSININFDKLSNFLREKERSLVDVLRSERYEMIILSVKYLTERERMKEVDIGRLEIFIGEYRRSSLSHYAMGFGPAGESVRFAGMLHSDSEAESL